MPGRSSDRLRYSVLCGCGAQVALDARSFGRPVGCSACRGSVTVAWGRDPRSHASVPVVVQQKSGPKAAAPKPAIPGIQKQEKFKPSAPLLPLHLRPPIRVRVKPGAQFFECPCGERNMLVKGSIGRTVQCPACDRLHTIEEMSAAAAAPPPETRAAGGGSAPSRPLRLGEFVCKCGEIQPPRTSRTGKDFECKACGRKGHVVPGRGEKGAPVLTPVFTGGPSREAEPPVSESRKSGWICPCGNTLEPQAVTAKKEFFCPSCGRPVKVEPHRNPQTMITTLRPVFSQDAPASSGSTTTVVFRELDPFEPAEDEAVFEVSAGDASDELPAAATDAQVTACRCGAELLISREDAGRTILCPACSKASVVEAVSGVLRLRPL